MLGLLKLKADLVSNTAVNFLMHSATYRDNYLYEKCLINLIL